MSEADKRQVLARFFLSSFGTPPAILARWRRGRIDTSLPISVTGWPG